MSVPDGAPDGDSESEQKELVAAVSDVYGAAMKLVSMPYKGAQQVNKCLVRNGFLPPPWHGFLDSEQEAESGDGASEQMTTRKPKRLPTFPPTARIFRTELGTAIRMGEEIDGVTPGHQVNNDCTERSALHRIPCT